MRLLIAEFEGLNPDISDELSVFLKKRIEDIDISIAHGLKLPMDAYSKVRRQFNALELLRRVSSDSKYGLRMGLCGCDLFVPGLNFVFGVARQNSCLLSTYRFGSKLYPRFLHRLHVVALHELGHCIGLKHCSNPECCMHFHNSVYEVDISKEWFCDRCEKLFYRFIRHY